METARDVLAHLGLTEKEAVVYLALYRLGEATAYEIAKEAGIKRPTVYLITEELRKKGLALIVPNPHKRLYVAKDPHEFAAEYQAAAAKNTQKLFALLPSKVQSESSVRTFKGRGALAQGLAYGLSRERTKSVCAFYTGMYPNTKINPAYYEHLEELGAAGFKMRAIIPKNSIDSSFRQIDAQFETQIRKLPSDIFSPSVSTEVFDAHTKLIFHRTREVLVIENETFCDFLRQLFELSWQAGTK